MLNYNKVENIRKNGRTTFKIPSRLIRLADTNVAATPIKAHNPLNPPMIDGFRPVKEFNSVNIV